MLTTQNHFNSGEIGQKNVCVHIYFDRWQTWALYFSVLSPVAVQLGTLLSICGNQWPKWPEMKNRLPTMFQYLLSSTSGQGMELSATCIQNKCQHWQMHWQHYQRPIQQCWGKDTWCWNLYLYIHQVWDLQGWATTVIKISLIRNTLIMWKRYSQVYKCLHTVI